MVKRLKAELTAASLIVMAVMGACLFWLFGSSYKSDICSAAKRELSAIAAAPENAESGSEEQLFDDEYILKADAAAEMIRLDTALLTDTGRLRETAALLGFDELHITDENGIIWWGTEESSYGFDFSKSDMTEPMLGIIADKEQKTVSPTGKNSFGIEIKYAAVARKDSSGIVMAGIRAENLPVSYQPSEKTAYAEYLFGQNGFIFIFDKQSGIIESFPADRELVGESVYRLEPQTQKLTDGFEGKTELFGEKYFCIAKESKEHMLCAAIPLGELYGSRNEAVVTAVIMGLAVLFACRIMAGLDYKHNVIKRIKAFSERIREAGEEDCLFDERSCAEYAELSDSLNSTLSSLRNELSERDKEKLRAAADRVREAAARQSQTAERFDRELAGVFERMGECGRVVDSTVKSAQRCERLALDGGAGMSGMMASFYNINELSSQIRELTLKMEELAETTGKLAFTAAIEASRAGENGQRFASIADQVRKLASKSAASAGEVITLSRDLSEAAKSGGDEARYSVGNFGNLEESSKSCVNSVKSLTEINRAQAAAIRDCAALLSEITESAEMLREFDFTSENEPLPTEEEQPKETSDFVEPTADAVLPETVEPDNAEPNAVFEPKAEEKAAPTKKAEPVSENESVPVTDEPAVQAERRTEKSAADENSKKLDSMVEALLAARAARKAAEAKAEKAKAASFDDSILEKSGENRQKSDSIEQIVYEMLDELSQKQ